MRAVFQIAQNHRSVRSDVKRREQAVVSWRDAVLGGRGRGRISLWSI